MGEKEERGGRGREGEGGGKRLRHGKRRRERGGEREKGEREEEGRNIEEDIIEREGKGRMENRIGRGVTRRGWERDKGFL